VASETETSEKLTHQGMYCVERHPKLRPATQTGGPNKSKTTHRFKLLPKTCEMEQKKLKRQATTSFGMFWAFNTIAVFHGFHIRISGWKRASAKQGFVFAICL
jgi:hypothetical protein